MREPYIDPYLDEGIAGLRAMYNSMKCDSGMPEDAPEPAIGEGHFTCPHCQGTIIMGTMRIPANEHVAFEISGRLVDAKLAAEREVHPN
jgi:hypothetical protein